MKDSVEFAESFTKPYDIAPLMEKSPHVQGGTKDETLPDSVRVEVGGYGIIWNEDINHCCDELCDDCLVFDYALASVKDLAASKTIAIG